MFQYELGFPVKNSAFICVLYFKEKYQRQGYGRELINVFGRCLGSQGYSELQMCTSKKLWTALYFWARVGFDKITYLCKTHELADDQFSFIELAKALKN